MTTDKIPGGEMTPQDFEDLLDRHGVDLARWPEDVRTDAQALAERSDQARAALRDAKALSSVLEQAPAGEVHSALAARILATAPGVDRNAEQTNQNVAQGGWLNSLISALWPEFGWVRPAGLMLASLVAGLYVGIAAPSAETVNEETDLFAYVFEVPNTWDTGDWQ